MPNRRGGEAGDDGGWQRRRLYLIFDDWPWGYSIRELPRHDLIAGGGGDARRRMPLPRPFIRVEACGGYPLFFVAVGTRIVLTHPRNTWDDDSVPGGYMPFIDVRSRGVTFGPGKVIHDIPIYLPVKNMLFALDSTSVMVLSFKPLWPPRLERPRSIDDDDEEYWAWRKLPKPPPPSFDRIDVTSYAVHPDDRTVLVSTTQKGTFAFDTGKLGGAVADTEEEEELAPPWTTRLGEWSMPFAGRAHYVHCLDAFVGLSNDQDTLGHLCSCSLDTGGGGPQTSSKLGKEKLFSEDPAETHVGATLLHMGGSEFCLVQSVSIEHDMEQLVEVEHDMEQLVEDDDGDITTDDDEERIEEEEEGQLPRSGGSHLYRVTTFSLSYDSNGDLTTGETCQVRCYRVPKATTERFINADPVAFCL